MNVFLPCLLERWSSAGGVRTGARGVLNTWQDVRRDVMRNLEWLLNTEAPARLAGRELPPAVANSVLCFGINPYSGRAQSSLSPSEIAWSIRERIIAFEPRLDRHTVEVLVQDRDGHTRFNKMRFTVIGQLRADPMPIEFIAQAEIDTDNGVASVSS
jgi:type VI secretion system protein ImpF